MREAASAVFGTVRRRGLAVALFLAIAGSPGPGFAQALVLRHPWPDAHATLQRLANEYGRQWGVRVRVVYDHAAPAAGRPIPAGTDIAGLRRFGATQPAVAALARAGRAQNISPWMDISWRSGFVAATLQPFAIQRGNRWGAAPGIYGVPLSSYGQFFLYRPDLFARAGVRSDPQRWRWSDFLDAGRRLRAIRVEPLVGAFNQRSHPALAQMYEQAHLGTSGLFATYRGDASYRSPGWRNLFRQYVDMRQAGIGTGSLAFASRPVAEAAFMQGRAAMLVDGPWFASVQARQAPGFTGWRVFLPPRGGWGARFMPAVPGGVADGLVVNPRSARKRQAVAFIRWLTNQVGAQTAYANATWMLPATWAAARSSSLHPRLQPFGRYVAYLSTDPAVFEDPAVNRVLADGLIAVLRGRSTPEAVLARADRLKARARRR